MKKLRNESQNIKEDTSEDKSDDDDIIQQSFHESQYSGSGQSKIAKAVIQIKIVPKPDEKRINL